MRITKFAIVPLLVISSHFAFGQSTVVTASATGTYGFQDANNAGTYVAQTSYAAGIGEYYAPGSELDILTFQLPTIPTSDTFTGASLYNEIYGTTGAIPPANSDLYALGISAAPVYNAATQFYTGPSDPNPSVTLIQSGYLTPTSGNGDPGSGNQDPIFSSVAGSTALATYLNSVDVNNAAAGEYLELRINYDATPSGYYGYNLLTAGAGGSTEQPTLTLTYAPQAVPEPSTYVLIGLGGLGLLLMMRRKKSGLAS